MLNTFLFFSSLPSSRPLNNPLNRNELRYSNLLLLYQAPTTMFNPIYPFYLFVLETK